MECREIVNGVKMDVGLVKTDDLTSGVRDVNVASETKTPCTLEDVNVNITSSDTMADISEVKNSQGEVCQSCLELEREFAKNPGGLPHRRLGLILAAGVGGAALAITSICVPFVLPAMRKVCLPFVPATSQQVNNVTKALKGQTGTLLDIGSGDGRIVLEAARQGFKSHGVELNRWLVLYSRYNALRGGLRGQATFARQDLWTTDMGRFNNVVIFGVEQMMSQLESKLEKELASGSVVVACRFKFPTWKPLEEIGGGVDTVWKYKMR